MTNVVEENKGLSVSSSITAGRQPTREQTAAAIREGSVRIMESAISADLFSAWGTEGCQLLWD